MQAEFLQDGLGVTGEILEHLESTVRMHDLDELHFVELVHADDALVIAAGGSRLAAETRGVGDHFHRQGRLGQYGIAVKVGHRNLGGGREEQAVDPIVRGLGAIHVVLEFRELAGALHALAFHEMRDVDLLVSVRGLCI